MFEDVNCACGPQSAPEFFRCWLSDKFNLACIFHDIDYTRSKYTRKQADKIFLRRMLKQSKNFKDRCVARCFYFMVRIFGFMFYEKRR